MTQAIYEEKSIKRTVSIVSALAAFLTSFLMSSVTLVLPAIGMEFDASSIELGWIVNSFSLSSGISLLIFGKVGDMAGRKKIFFLGMLVYTVTTFLMIFIWNVYMMILLRVLQGLANAMIFGTIMAIITAVFEPGERGNAVGLNLTSTYLGLSLGPVLGGLLTQYMGWRSVFICLVPLFAICLVLIAFKLKLEWFGPGNTSFDLRGSMLYGISLFAFMFGFSILPSLAGWLCLSCGLLFGIMFYFAEQKAQNPIFDFKLIFNNRMFTFSSLSSIIVYTSIATVGFFTSLFLQYLKGLDAKSAGFIMITQPLTTALLSLAAGRLSDKKSPGIIASIGMGITSLGLILFSFINEGTNVFYLVFLLVLIGMGFGLFSSPNTNAIMSSVDKKYLGLASGALGTMRGIGQIFSMGIAMMLFTIYIGSEAITPAVYPSLIMSIQKGFFTFGIICFLGIGISLARNGGKKKPTAQKKADHT